MGIINPLPQSVVNRIAAGEVVVRPANAVKELIENSLDAGATEIIVTVKQGGLQLLQVQDNGKGFIKEDLEMACVRFATSKLHDFEDLNNMQTFGFRGEALASISLVSKVTITSRCADQPCAYLAKYNGCKMVTIKPSAGNQGTCITSEELFYDAPSRRQSLKAHEEASRVEDIVTKYAVHRPDVSFALRGASSVYRTKGDGNQQAVINSLIGPEFAQNMVKLMHSAETLKYRLNGSLSEPISTATASTELAKRNRRKTFFLFINGRLVNCNTLRQSVETLFSNRDMICPFIFLSLELEPNRIDVNVHPTKDEVIFLEEDAIVDDVCEYISSLIPSSNSKQPTQGKSLESFGLKITPYKSKSARTSETNASLIESEKRIDHSQVRTDHLERRLHVFSKASTSFSQIEEDVEMIPISRQNSDKSSSADSQICESFVKRDLQLESLHNMKEQICEGASQSLRELFKEHIFVGCVDPERVLVQHGTALYAIDLKYILEEYFYQAIVFGFGNLGCFKLEEPIPVFELCCIAYEANENAEDIAQTAVGILFEYADLLRDYLTLSLEVIAAENYGEVLCLTGIPSLVNGYLPQFEGLPKLIMDLVEVPWNSDEQTCLEAVSRAVAQFFTIKKEFCDVNKVSGMPESAEWLGLIRDHLLPRAQHRLVPQEKFKNNDIIVRVVDQHDMYNIFERC